MAKYLTLANDSMLVGIDGHGHVRDFYFPYVGLENHVSGASGSFLHRIGVWVDGAFAWLDDPSWKVDVGATNGTLCGSTHATNRTLQVTLSLTDSVHHEKNIFLREIVLVNTAPETRTIKLFFAQQFRIAEDRTGSTGFYDPRIPAIIHYKGRTTFLVNAMSEGRGFDDYGVGLFNMESREGTYMDALDGMLSKNPIEHGSVDSVIGFTFSIPSCSQKDISYWVAAGETVHDVHELDTFVQKKGPATLVRSTVSHWKSWLHQGTPLPKSRLDPELIRLYEHSLLVLRTHTDGHGGIIASSDSDILNYGRDTYSYVWPRDAAVTAHALIEAGHTDTPRLFFEFIKKILEPEGYLMHKYRSDGALGSSWHPWMWRGKPDLPIQEDETATILFVLWKYFEKTGDKAYIESLYETMIAPMAHFLLHRIDPATSLTVESYDLWEEVHGISTYTSASVYGGLMAAGQCALLLGKVRHERAYTKAALKLRTAITTHLFDETRGVFFKYIREKEGGFEKNSTLDISSFHGITYFGVLDATDTRVQRMYDALKKELLVPTDIGGYIRYAGDQYYRISEHDPSNPWVVTTLWMARYYIQSAHTQEDLAPALAILTWVRRCALSTYILPEQMHPHTGIPLSATPLVWSHAEYVLAVHEYSEKYTLLEHAS